MVYCPKRLILRHLAQPILLKLCRVMTDFDNVKFSKIRKEITFGKE